MKTGPSDTPRNPDPRTARIVLAGGAAAFLGSLWLYVKTMAASTSFWDSGEFIAAAHTLGVPHSPGTPLYIIVAKSFALLPIPGLSVAERINLLSAVCGAAGVVFVYLVVVRLLALGREGDDSMGATALRVAGALVGTFFLAASDTYWNNAIEAEVYAMSTALMGLMTWLALKWNDGPKRPRSTYYIFALFYLLALSVGFHLGTILVFSGIFLFVLMTRDKSFSNFEFFVACFGVGIFIADATLYRNGQLTVVLLLAFLSLLAFVTRTRSPFALACTGLFVLGLSVHLYLMIRSGHNPSIDEGNPETWRSLWAVLRREQYPPTNVWARKADLAFQFQQFNGYFQAQFQLLSAYAGKLNLGSLVPIALGVWGMVDHYARHRRTFVMAFATLLVMSVGLILFLNFSDSEVRERDYFYSPAFYYFAVYIGLGAGSLLLEARRLFSVRAPRLVHATYACAGALMILPAFTVQHHYFTHDRSRNTVCQEYGRNMLVGLDRDAILFTWGDNDTFPIWYAQEVEGVRRDVRVVNLSLAQTPWYLKQCRDNEPKVPIAWNDAQIDRLAPVPSQGKWLMVYDLVVRQVLQTNGFKRPVYFAVTIRPEIYQPYREYLEFEGLAYRVVPRRGENMVNVERLEQNLTQECKFDSILTAEHKRDRSVYLAPATENVIANYAVAFSQLAFYQHRDGRYVDAAQNMAVAHEISPNISVPRRLLGLYYLDAGDTTRAVDFYEDELRRNPDDVDAMYALAGVYERVGRTSRALDLLDLCIDAAPDDRDLVVTAFRVARSAGFEERARRYASAWLSRHPGDEEFRSELLGRGRPSE